MAKTSVKQVKYFEGIGRRKTAIARVRFYPTGLDIKGSELTVNGIDYKD